MIDKRAFSFIDVFVAGSGRFSGNQLAVVPDASGLSADAMQEIAREFHFSETVFITGRNGGAFAARIFTPAEQIPFAGHPTFGLAHYVRERILRAPVPVGIDFPVGRILVQKDEGESDLLWMLQREPAFGAEFPRGAVAAALSLAEPDLDPRYPPMEVSTGLPFLIVPLAEKDALARSSPDRAGIRALFESRAPLGLYPFASAGPGRFEARMFAPHLGVEEDPATGSAAGCLAAYLSSKGFSGSFVVDAVIEQGAMVKRPSIIRIRTATSPTGAKVFVGGKARIVAQGEMEIG